MDLVLQAIETSEGLGNSNSHSNSPFSNDPDAPPPLSFEQRPPQWCIVEKWFTMKVVCYDDSIKELEAVVYNRNDGDIIRDIQAEKGFTNDSKGRRAIVSVDKDKKATFKLKFLNGSKGAWLEVGFHASAQDKCLLKSPPIKVQTNRSKRPRDSKKKPIPIVTSLSPHSVPSSGSFPGGKDRMLLIFGSNFHLWGSSPILRLEFVDSDSFLDIRPPDLIWWNENLLECQLPECANDLQVKVANYDYIFGEGRILKVNDNGSHADDSRLLQLEKPLGKIVDYQQLTNSHLVLDFTQLEPNEEVGSELIVKIVLYVRLDSSVILADTMNGTEQIPLEDLGIVLKLINKQNNQIIREVTPMRDQKFWRNADNMMVTLKIPLETTVAPRALQVVVNLRQESTRLALLDPSTKSLITAEKPLLGDPIEDENSMDIESGSSSSPEPRISEPFVFRSNILKSISKTEELGELDKWEGILMECAKHLRTHRNDLERKRDRRSLTHSQGSYSTLSSLNREEEYPLKEDDQDKTIAVPQISPDGTLKQSTVYWKFFNPGTRTFLELCSGKLQIIGSRRIQMLIESIPANAKFINAYLYVQKGEAFEVIENCNRCKENGIPNVFCVLPRRGREHDYPWITFRITCTSTAKHWKGSPFWIGAEFLVDPSVGNVIKVFSPPIHVQSKVKSKDIAERAPPKYSPLSNSSTSSHPPSFRDLQRPSLDNFYALTQHSSAQLQQQKQQMVSQNPTLPHPTSFAVALSLATQLSRIPSSSTPPATPEEEHSNSSRES